MITPSGDDTEVSDLSQLQTQLSNEPAPKPPPRKKRGPYSCNTIKHDHINLLKYFGSSIDLIININFF